MSFGNWARPCRTNMSAHGWDTIDDAELAISALTVREVAKGVTKLAFSKPGVAIRSPRAPVPFSML